MNTLDLVVSDLAGRQHGVFAFRQIVPFGATKHVVRRRTASGRWHVEFPAVYRISGSPETWESQVMAAVLASGDDAAAARRCAARLHGIAGFAGGGLELAVPRPRTPELPRVLVHRSTKLPAHHVTAVVGIPVTTAARTLFDLAGSVHPLRAERALDTCLARNFVTVDGAWRVLDDLAQHGRAGTVLMRELLQARGAGYVATSSELEALFLRILRDAGVPEPEREVDLGDVEDWVGRVDFVFRPARLVVEVDGRAYHTALLDRERDERRDNRLMAAGWRVLRFTWRQLVERPHEVVALVRAALAAAAA